MRRDIEALIKQRHTKVDPHYALELAPLSTRSGTDRQHYYPVL